MKSSEISIGSYTYDTGSGRIRHHDGSNVELRHQSREVLRVLAEAPGEVVGKDVFFDRVWGKAHVSEDSLAQCIAEIRQALGDKRRTIVETVPRRGYRLNGKVRHVRAPRNALIAGAVALVLIVGFAMIASLQTPEPAPRVVAVLPFADVSAGEHQGLLSDPVSDGILAHLARYPELTVIARGSSFRFRDPDRDMPAIGAQLGADYLVEGSLHSDGQHLVVTSALVDVEANAQVWTDRIEVELSDLFDAIAQIGQRVAFQIEATVSDAQVAQAGAHDVDALLLNLRARRASRGGLSAERNEAELALNREAVRLYPDEAWGHIGMAMSLRLRLRFGWAEDPVASLAEAIDHAETAVALSPENYAAHFALGRVRMQEGNQLRAIEAFERTLQLNPSSADAMNALAQSYLYLGQNAHALEALGQSALIDPLPSFVHSWASAWVLWQDERCEEAATAFARIPAPPPPAHKLLSAIHICLGETEAAAAALAVFLESAPNWTLDDETALHAPVWVFDGGRERWLADLKAAGLPES